MPYSVNRFKKIRKRSGFKSAVRDFAGWFVGLDSLKENVDSLFYYLDGLEDISMFPKAEGPLGILQKCDSTLLQIFTKFCGDHHLTFFLDWGTLLGCAKHKGFIPWDDDLDVSMPIDDYLKAIEILPGFCERYGFSFEISGHGLTAGFGIGYKKFETGIWMDVFPLYYGLFSDNGAEEVFNQNMPHYKMRFKKMKDNNSFSELALLKSSILMRNNNGGKKYYFQTPEFDCNVSKYHYLYEESDFFPTVYMSFEGFQVPVPSNWELILTNNYGDYMKFPKGGLCHHSLNGVPLSEIASKSNDTLLNAYSRLTTILNTMEGDNQ